MMRPQALLPWIPVLLIGSLASPALGSALGLSADPPADASAQEQETHVVDFQAVLQAEVQRTESMDVDQVWTRLGELASLGKSSSFQKEVGQFLAQADANQSSSAARLLMGSLHLQAEDPDLELLSKALMPLLSSDGDWSSAAAGLLGNARFRALDRSSLSDLLGRLGDAAEDGDADPVLRLEAADALFSLGRGDERRMARNVMRDFFFSEDAELKALGSLALARAGNELVGELRNELKALAQLPNERGLRAAAYLKQEDIRELSERKLKNLEESLRGAADIGGSGSGGNRRDPAFGTPEHQFRLVQKMIRDWHIEGDKVEPEDLLDAALDGMLRALDQHSTFMSSSDYKRFEQDLEAAYGGIGAYVGEDREDGLFTITRPIFTGPAYKAGLSSDDKIVQIDDWPTLGKTVEDIIKRLKGRPGTDVKIYVWRRGMDRALIDRPTEDMAVTIERAAITIPPVQSQLLPGKVGMVELRDFSRVASSEMSTHINTLLERGATSIILDLRQNSGGLLDEAVNVSGLFLPKGSLVVSTESRVRRTEKHYTKRPPVVPEGMPVGVLIGRFSASASEIVAGALRDHDRAVLVGNRSYGKGSVQNLVPLSNYRDDAFTDENNNRRHDNWETITHDYNGNGEFDFAPRIKMTIARYLLPMSGSIHRELDDEGNILDLGGVDPDVEVDARTYDGWRLEEIWRLRNSRVARDYVEEHAEGNETLFSQLADNDFKDPGRYPEFDSFYESLNTIVPKDDVRLLVRAEIRRRVQDARGREFPPGDFVEDRQVQAAVTEMLEKQGLSPSSIPDYAASFETEKDLKSALAKHDSDRRREIRDRLDAARRGEGQLTAADLTLLVEVFDEVDR